MSELRVAQEQLREARDAQAQAERAAQMAKAEAADAGQREAAALLDFEHEKSVSTVSRKAAFQASAEAKREALLRQQEAHERQRQERLAALELDARQRAVAAAQETLAQMKESVRREVAGMAAQSQELLLRLFFDEETQLRNALHDHWLEVLTALSSREWEEREFLLSLHSMRRQTLETERMRQRDAEHAAATFYRMLLVVQSDEATVRHEIAGQEDQLRMALLIESTNAQLRYAEDLNIRRELHLFVESKTQEALQAISQSWRERLDIFFDLETAQRSEIATGEAASYTSMFDNWFAALEALRTKQQSARHEREVAQARQAVETQRARLEAREQELTAARQAVEKQLEDREAAAKAAVEAAQAEAERTVKEAEAKLKQTGEREGQVANVIAEAEIAKEEARKAAADASAARHKQSAEHEALVRSQLAQKEQELQDLAEAEAALKAAEAARASVLRRRPPGSSRGPPATPGSMPDASSISAAESLSSSPVAPGPSRILNSSSARRGRRGPSASSVRPADSSRPARVPPWVERYIHRESDRMDAMTKAGLGPAVDPPSSPPGSNTHHEHCLGGWGSDPSSTPPARPLLRGRSRSRSLLSEKKGSRGTTSAKPAFSPSRLAPKAPFSFAAEMATAAAGSASDADRSLL
eukprot:NODE_391_length_2122_cov_7.050169_g314_i0.p1 GENE.NODE_391_length_2122_cov_7.050169_g314_i0~~NODE_391_length_2122_cov_7.050169_g314_i0.p1  ORF type:complete len:692 (+),score=200.62 NODE_391_length_2122_cov_7.050169_g314_i0:139-2076(+)